MVIIAAVIVFLLWLFCILQIPQFPNNACMSLSLGGVLGGGSGGGGLSPSEATDPSAGYSVTLDADNKAGACAGAYDRFYITSNIPNGGCEIYFSPANVTDGEWEIVTQADLGANGAWSDSKVLPSGVGTYKYTAICVDRGSVDYGVSPYLMITTRDCSAPDRMPCPYTPPALELCNCPAGYFWDTGFQQCVRTTA